MPQGDIFKLPSKTLLTLLRQAKDDVERAKSTKDMLESVIRQRYEQRAHQLRQEQGLDTGTVRLDDDGITVVANLPKKVEWDQKKLSPIIEKLTSEGWNIQQIAKVEYKVSERLFNELPTGVRAMLEEARTLNVGKPTFKLEEPKEGEQ